jgi:serine/threonine protein kinase
MEMFTGEIPRIDEVKGLVGVKFFEQLRDNKPKLPKNLPVELEEFLNLCFSWKPEDRPTTEELLQHPFLTKDFKKEEQIEHEKEHEVEVHETTVVDGQVLIPNQNRNSVAMKQSELDAEKHRENLLDELLKEQETLRKEREKLEKEKKLIQIASENLQKKQSKIKEEELRKKKKSKPKGLAGKQKEIKKEIMSNSTLEADQSDFKLDQLKKVPSSNLSDE